MGNQAWTLTVSYVNGSATITDANGGKGDETIFRGETDTITLVPGSGVASVTSFTATTTYDSSKITITQRTSGNNLIVIDTDNLLAGDNEEDISYCIGFTDTNRVARTTDPQLINKPTIRPN